MYRYYCCLTPVFASPSLALYINKLCNNHHRLLKPVRSAGFAPKSDDKCHPCPLKLIQLKIPTFLLIGLQVSSL